ncbi:MAG TPA: hypothetical protein VEU96_04335 [Bryobacteraceae bacterium]|nr:hypothetical protein [Bryobacteraceae bacterium]
MMIAGKMAKWQQYGHRAPLVIVPLFGALMWWGFHTAPSPSKGRNSFAIIFLIVLALTMIGGVLRFWKKIVKEFTYDGRTFTFNTLASPEMQMRDLSAIEEVADWSGRGGPLGFCIKFRDGAKLYLHNGVSNAAALAERMRSDLGSSALDTLAAASRRPARLALMLVIAICAGLLAAVATSKLLQRLPPEISRTEFLSEVNQRHVDKVVIRDRTLISGTSSTRGAFRVRIPVDDVMLNDLRSRGVAVEFETSSGLTP